MKICEYCGNQITSKDESIPTKIYPELGIEVETRIHQHDTAFKDIVIPTGWRLLIYIEAITLLNDETFVEAIQFQNKKNDFYIESPFKKIEMAWLGCYDSYFYLYSSDNLIISNASRGVLFCRDLKENEKVPKHWKQRTFSGEKRKERPIIKEEKK